MEKKNRPLQAANSDIRVSDVTPLTKSLQAPKRTSGINTEAEANRYFQGMPKPDFSSPEALQQSMRDIQQYTDNYNQQYNVNVGKSQRQQSQPAQVSQPAASSNFSSLWGD